MKKLTKIKLINWHIFWNETISVNGNILITGENATGKSTLIDAIFFVLTGGNEKFFNSAANSRAQRTLETYMRCKTGVDGKEYLRPGENVVSHIALEFIDSEDGRPFVIGTALEIRDNNAKPDQRFYHVVDSGIDDLQFFVSGKVVNFRMFRDLSKREEIDIETLDGSKAEIRYSIAVALGVNNKKYNELLPKAIAFRPITEVSQFVYSFLLPERNVNLDRIREDIREFREIKEIIERDQLKHEDLVEICENGEKYRNNILELNSLQFYLKKKEFDILLSDISSCERKLKSLKMKESELILKLKQEEENLEIQNEKKYEIRNSDSYKIIEKNAMWLEAARREEEEAVVKEKSFNKRILDLAKQLKTVGIKNKLSSAVENRDHFLLREELAEIAIEITEIRKNISEELGNFYSEKKRLCDLVDSLRIQKESLEHGIYPYPEKVEELRKFIQQGLENKTGKSEDVRPLCEFLELDTEYENWRNVLEGILGSRRFDLVVRPDLFEFASELYYQFNQSHKCADIGIIDTSDAWSGNSEISKEKGEKLFLSEMIVAEDIRARKYIDSILGEFVALKTTQAGELLKANCSADISSMYYSDDAIRPASEEVYSKPYIGTKSIQIQLENVNRQFAETCEAFRQTVLKVEQLEKKQQIVSGCNPMLLEEELNPWELLEKCRNKIRILKDENDKLRNDNFDLFSRLDSIEVLICETKKRKDEIAESERITNKEVGSCEERLKTMQSAKDELEKVLDSFLYDSSTKIVLEKFVAESNLTKRDTEEKIVVLEKSVERYKNQVCNLMGSYIEKYSFDSKPDVACLDDFSRELNQVIDRNLVQFREKAAEAEINCRKGFQDSYIAEIRKHIFDERENINRLNRILSTKPFGNDGEIYRFEVSRSKNPEFGVFYDVFISNQDFNVTELFSDALSSKNSSLMNDLFDRITRIPRDDKEEKLLREFTDYRMFMDYDIKITNSKGEVSSFSKINREKSGGETQTPFYVIIAASFDQLSREANKQSSGCVVILDEAFNNMDESRISAMMEYFNQLKIQLIIVVPPERFKTIFQHVDTTIALTKSNNRAICVPLYKGESND